MHWTPLLVWCSFIFMHMSTCQATNWDLWWTYDGISGHGYWGVLNPNWQMCQRGKKQSPIDIKPENLVYDPSLEPLVVDGKTTFSGVLYNTGQLLVLKMDYNDMQTFEERPRGLELGSLARRQRRPADTGIHIAKGPLAYRYRFTELYLHWGETPLAPHGYHDATKLGSEHTINGKFFPAEIQLIGYNSEIFNNLSEASSQAHGVVQVAILVAESDSDRDINPVLSKIVAAADKVVYRGQNLPISNLRVGELLPETEGYVTYEGSLTQPPCNEVSTWIVMNRPIYLNRNQLNVLRRVMQGEKTDPKAPIAANSRPRQEINRRILRTNIAFKDKTLDNVGGEPKNDEKKCPDVASEMFYKANDY